MTLASVVFALVASGLSAQDPTPAPAPIAAEEYKVGAGDVLEVVVFGNDDLSRTATVQTNGTIALPLLGDVDCTGLTLAELQKRLVALLAKDYLVNPQVEVRVREYQSQFVTVVGEVNRPGRQSLKGKTRLIDALVEAGGFTPRASGDVVITRAEGFPAGEHELKLHLGSAVPTGQDRVNLEVPLRTGDLITAAPKAYVIVEGEVNRPGRYAIDGELTVTGAIATAGGLTRFGSNDLRVIRADQTTLEIDFKAIRKGKKPDVVLMPNDIVTVPRRVF